MVLSCFTKVDMVLSVRVTCALKVGSSSSVLSTIHSSADPGHFVLGASV